MSSVFYVFGCPECGSHQADEVRTTIQKHTFKCRRDSCAVSRKTKRSDLAGLALKHHGPYLSARHAAAMVSALNVPEKLRKVVAQ